MLSEVEIYAALRAVETDVNGRQFRSAAALERLVTGLSNLCSPGVQRKLWELCNECVQELANAHADERSPETDADEQEDVHSGVIRVLSAVVNCVDGARCEVDAGLLQLLLRCCCGSPQRPRPAEWRRSCTSLHRPHSSR